MEQVERIARSNRAASDDFDSALKDLVATAAAAISSFHGNGERHKSSLTSLADGFEALARVEDVSELRRRLREDVGKLRQSVDEMRRENQQAVRHFDSQIASFQVRLEAARKGSAVDRLTLLGSRRSAEQRLQKLSECKGPVSALLFEIEGFRRINGRYGPLFGDKLLQALAHLLRETFPADGALFRWGPDEFLVIAEGPAARAAELCRSIAASAIGSPTASSLPTKAAARNAWPRPSRGEPLHTRPGESIERLCLLVRENLEQNRGSVAP